MLRPNWGNDINLVGKQEHSFAVEGPIVQVATPDSPGRNLAPGPRSSLVALQGELELGWQQAELFGIVINKSTIPATLANGKLRVGPTRLPVGSGSVGLDGTLQFAPPPRLLTLAPGDLVSRVELTPNMCASGIKYVAPLLAEATQTQGSFSLQLTQAQLPMSNPASGVVDGRLTIHSGQIRPGPLAQAIVGLTSQIIGAIDRNGGQVLGSLNLNNPLLTIEEQTTDFRLVQRRVYHRGMQIHLGTVEVNSRGSVGLDQSLDIVIDIPVQSRWFAKKPDLAKAFNGTILSIPIRGTLHQPQIDNQVLGQLLARFATEMLHNSAEDLILQGLDRLFRPRNP